MTSSASSVEYVEANGIRFAYVSEGKGPLVLMFHGFPDTPHTWDDVRPKLAARGYRVVTPFLRGYAPTAIPKRDTDMMTLGNDALALVEALGEKSAIMVGHDWGAVAVYGAATLGPERVKKLIVVAIPHPVTFVPTLRKAWGVRHFLAYKLPGAGARFAKDDFAALRGLYRRWSPTWDPPESELEAIKACFADPASREAAFGYYRSLPLRPPPHMRLKITVPTVAFAGFDDSIALLSDYENARRMYTGDYTVEGMPGGHFLHREHAEEFARLLFKHLP
ncbi:alpha/beta hydrolase [soil metagenome]